MTRFFLSPIFLISLLAGLINIPVLSSSNQGQGVKGYVYRISGNQMPSPDRKPAKPMGVVATLYIFELTNINQVSRMGQTAFYRAVRTKLVRKLESGADGFFSVQLPPGSYSFFTKKNELFYANWFDASNNIAPVAVLPEKMTAIEIRIDYDANY
jgi:hypothetical protein